MRVRQQGVRLAIAAGLLVCVEVVSAQPGQREKPRGTAGASTQRSRVLATVNGKKITEADLDRIFRVRNVPAENRSKLRQQAIEDLIDSRLIGEYLEERKAAATRAEVDFEINRIRELAARKGAEPDRALTELGLPVEALREEISTRLAWKRHVEKTWPAPKLKEYFAAHRAEFDGTQVRARQIVIRAPSGDSAARAAARETLASLRSQIAAKKVSFADAARDRSEAPSRDAGGDVGYFPYSGKMPGEVAHVAFRLKVGELSEPFETPFGVHLLETTDRKPGDLSLEDVRDEVISRLSRDMWVETVARLRKSAKIERTKATS